MSTPEKFDTIVSENGANFSIGQKQRLAIARALLKKSPIILFDEPTSALDNESQCNFKKSINTISKNHTIIIISHRLFTIIDADLIYVFDKGKIVGKGVHNELIHSSSVYRNLYKVEVETLSSKTFN